MYNSTFRSTIIKCLIRLSWAVSFTSLQEEERLNNAKSIFYVSKRELDM